MVAAVAASAKIDIPAKNSDKEPVSSVNLHHFDGNFSLKRNHNVPGKQTDFLRDF